MKLNDASPQEWDAATSPKNNSAVNNPAHYNTGDIECIDAIESSMSPEQFQSYLKGNCIKYLWRMSYKGKKLEDTLKAKWYLSRMIENIKANT